MLGRFAELILFGFAPMMFGALLMPGAYAAEEIVVLGEVTYRERIALPPNAVVTVRLTDVSLADAPGAVIAEQKIESAGQVPVKFELRYDPAVVQPKMSYALQARITVDDKLWFTTDERYSVDPLKPEPARLTLKMVRQESRAPSLFDTTWVAEDIEGGGVIDNAQSTLVVASDGAISGRGACNGYSAQAVIDGKSIRIGQARATLMACPPAVMDQERKLFDAFGKASAYRIDDSGKLFLVDPAGVDVARFSAV